MLLTDPVTDLVATSPCKSNRSTRLPFVDDERDGIGDDEHDALDEEWLKQWRLEGSNAFGSSIT